MILTIDTTGNKMIALGLKKNRRIIARENINIARHFEELLVIIDNFMNRERIEWKQIKKISVKNYGGSFSSLRIGIITANTLAYGLGIPVTGKIALKSNNEMKLDFVIPCYRQKPNITKKRHF
jgi:tRNA threonylcarbamoyladenosine biosynthesis protein TsaB